MTIGDIECFQSQFSLQFVKKKENLPRLLSEQAFTQYTIIIKKS